MTAQASRDKDMICSKKTRLVAKYRDRHNPLDGPITGPKIARTTRPYTRSRLREDARLVRLDRRLATPLFRQVYQRIRDAILDGTLPPGASLPSSRSLAAQLSTARGTIELAYTFSRRRLHPGADSVRYCCQSETQALVDAGREARAPQEVYSTSARTFPPHTGASISDGAASAGCVSAKALGPSHRAPGPESFRNRNGFSGPGWVRASASGDCRVLSHC